ncbi:hypothetical protein QTP88_001755 [Uroleucon formosanum]
MEVEHGNNVTATGASETPEPAVEGSRAPQKSSSATSAKSVDVLKQASSANQEVGTATVGEGGKQASAGGKTIEATATAHKEKTGNAPNLTDVTSGSLASRLLASNKQQGCPSNMLLAMTKLKSLIKAQNLLINKLCQGADCLGELGKLTRSDHVKGAIVEISSIVDEVVENRKQLLPAFNKALQLAIKLANGPEPCSTMPTPTDQNAANLQNQEAILKACDKLKTCFTQQQEEINELKRQVRPTYAAKAGPRTVSKRDRTHSSNTDEVNPQRHQATTRYNSVLNPTSPVCEPCTLVERTKTRKKQPRDSKVQARLAGTSRRNRPPPPDAIAIKPGEGETFAEILKAVRKDVDVDKTGAYITSIAESRNGEVVIRVARGHSERAKLETAISHALGSRPTVRGLVKYEDLDISGLDGVTTEAEIIEALEKAATLPSSDDSVRVKSLRPAPGGRKRATASMRSVDIRKITKDGRVKIGLIWARVRSINTVAKCHRCHGYGHTRFGSGVRVRTAHFLAATVLKKATKQRTAATLPYAVPAPTLKLQRTTSLVATNVPPSRQPKVKARRLLLPVLRPLTSKNDQHPANKPELLPTDKMDQTGTLMTTTKRPSSTSKTHNWTAQGPANQTSGTSPQRVSATTPATGRLIQPWPTSTISYCGWRGASGVPKETSC